MIACWSRRGICVGSCNHCTVTKYTRYSSSWTFSGYSLGSDRALLNSNYLPVGADAVSVSVAAITVLLQVHSLLIFLDLLWPVGADAVSVSVAAITVLLQVHSLLIFLDLLWPVGADAVSVSVAAINVLLQVHSLLIFLDLLWVQSRFRSCPAE
ncbi:hypothetical protein J6590_081717 [Homalodisca vitripennis]|nr:hypothetical protein J6590_081717 [Homalodisca vitripennis]